MLLSDREERLLHQWVRVLSEYKSGVRECMAQSREGKLLSYSYTLGPAKNHLSRL